MQKPLELLGLLALVLLLGSCGASSPSTVKAAAQPTRSLPTSDRVQPNVAGFTDAGLVVFGGATDPGRRDTARSDGAVIGIDDNSETDLPAAPFEANTKVISTAATMEPSGRLVVAAVLCRGQGFDPAADSLRCGALAVNAARLDVSARRWERLPDPVKPIVPSDPSFEVPAISFLSGADGPAVLRVVSNESETVTAVALSGSRWVPQPTPPDPLANLCRTSDATFALWFDPLPGPAVPATQGVSQARTFHLAEMIDGEWRARAAPELAPIENSFGEPTLACDADEAFLVQLDVQSREVVVASIGGAQTRRAPAGLALPTSVDSSSGGIAIGMGGASGMVVLRGHDAIRPLANRTVGARIRSDHRGRHFVISTSADGLSLEITPVEN